MIIKPNSTKIQIEVPKEYVGKTIEVTIKLSEEPENNLHQKNMADFWGIISDETAAIIRQEIAENRK